MPILSQPMPHLLPQNSLLRRTCSTNSIIPRTDESSTASTPLMKSIETSVLNAVLTKLPTIISSIVREELSAMKQVELPEINDKNNITEMIKNQSAQH